MYTLTIIGGGAMSCGYDNPKDENILTHTHGAIIHPKITLDSIVEINQERQIYIKDKWGEDINIYSKLEDSIKEYQSDIFIVATPTYLHLEVIENILLKCSPKLIICEKPIVSNLNEFNILNKLIKQSNTKIVTNFPRRFDESLNFLREKMRHTNKKYHFHGTFTKGLIHNGSHMIDLINMLVGNIYNIDSINKEIVNDDVFGQFLVETDSCKGIISNINSDKLSIFELTIYTNIAKIEIINSSKKITIKSIDKLNLIQNFEVYSLEEEYPWTLKKSAYNTFDYVIKLLEDDVQYESFEFEQYNINKLIFDTQKKLMEQG